MDNFYNNLGLDWNTGNAEALDYLSNVDLGLNWGQGSAQSYGAGVNAAAANANTGTTNFNTVATDQDFLQVPYPYTNPKGTMNLGVRMANDVRKKAQAQSKNTNNSTNESDNSKKENEEGSSSSESWLENNLPYLGAGAAGIGIIGDFLSPGPEENLNYSGAISRQLDFLDSIKKRIQDISEREFGPGNPQYQNALDIIQGKYDESMNKFEREMGKRNLSSSAVGPATRLSSEFDLAGRKGNIYSKLATAFKQRQAKDLARAYQQRQAGIGTLGNIRNAQAQARMQASNQSEGPFDFLTQIGSKLLTGYLSSKLGIPLGNKEGSED